MKIKRCINCNRKFNLYKHISNQKYCSRRQCQNVRKNAWTRQKLKRNKDYKTNKKEAQYKWRINNPNYWVHYKRNIADSARVNRGKAKQRRKTNNSKFKKPALKILLEKGLLAALHKSGTIKCDCSLSLVF